MSITTTPLIANRRSFWRKSLAWIQAFEEAMDYDPNKASIDRLTTQVTDLKNTVHTLQSQLKANEDPKH